MKTRSNAVFVALQFGLAAVACVLVLGAPRAPDRQFLLICLILVALSLLTVFAYKRTEPKPINWLTIDVLFSLTYTVIHFSYIAYWIFSFFSPGREVWSSTRVHCAGAVCPGVAMFTACLCFFLAGYYWLPVRRLRPLLTVFPVPANLRYQWGALGRFLVRCGFGGFAAYLAIVGPSVVFGVYKGTNVYGLAANIVFQLGQVLTVAGIAVATASKQQLFLRNQKRQQLFGLGYFDLGLIGLTIAAIGLHGDRSTLLFLFMGLLIAYNEYSKPISIKTLGVVGVAMVFLMGFIVTMRSGRETDDRWDPLVNINNALVNLGSSSLCGYLAIDYVPRRHDYYYGQMQSLQLAGIVPFGRTLFGMKDSVDNNSATLMTYLVWGRTGKGVAGAGTSLFADLYLDFGFAGASGLMFLLGLFSKWVQNKSRTSLSMFWAVFAVLLFAFLTVVSRYSFTGGVIRFVFYGVAYTTAAAYFLGIKLRYAPTLRRPRAPVMVPYQNTGN